MGSGSAVTTILKEAEIMKNLHHKHIVNLEDVFADGSHIYLVMELLSGGDLFDRVVSKTKYSEDDARELMYQLLDAISYLHGKGITHRDLKLENIMLMTKENDVNIKVTDFGLAKSGGKLKTFCGTPNYYAPEVLERRHTIRGEGSYSVAADMWSCGVILYVLLAGEMPWKGQDTDRSIREAKFTPMIGKKWASISSDVKALIKGLLEPNPAHRLTVDRAMTHSWFAGRRGQVTAGPCDSSETTHCMHIDSQETLSGSDIKTGISATMNEINIRAYPSAHESKTDIISNAKKRKMSNEAMNTKSELDDAPSKRRTMPRKCRSEKGAK